MNRIYIKPAREGAVVRHPEKLNHIIPAAGEEVTESTAWQRYINAGDVVIATPPVEAKAETKQVKGSK